MRTIYSTCLSIIISAFLAGNVYAAEDLGDLDVTIRMIDSKQNINEFIKRIELPKGAVETTPPPATGQTPKSTEGSSNTRRQPEDASHNRRDSNRNRDDSQNYSDHDEDKSGQQDQQTEPPAAIERPSMTDNNQRDSSDRRDHDTGSREHREQQDTSRKNWN